MAGVVVSDSGDIAEAFAQFHEDLYQEWVTTGAINEACMTDDAPEVTTEELTAALRRMTNGRTGGDDGLVSEMLCTEHVGLIHIVACFSPTS
eukprot:4103127-Pyramimonas_sp.AAC.1